MTKPTEQGLHTFSCKINDNLFQPKSHGGLFSSEPLNGWVFYNNGRRAFAFSANDFVNYPRRYINVQFENFNGPGVYHLSADSANYAIVQFQNPDRHYSTKSIREGYVNITKYDEPNKILAGRFEFKVARESNANEVISVTEGRFDIKLE